MIVVVFHDVFECEDKLPSIAKVLQIENVFVFFKILVDFQSGRFADFDLQAPWKFVTVWITSCRRLNVASAGMMTIRQIRGLESSSSIFRMYAFTSLSFPFEIQATSVFPPDRIDMCLFCLGIREGISAEIVVDVVDFPNRQPICQRSQILIDFRDQTIPIHDLHF
jgi:hypothetical protein